MSDQQPCDAISSATILSSSLNTPIRQRGESDKTGKKKQKRLLETESEEAVTPARYQPYDLKSLTFKPTGSEQEIDIWHATPEQFHGYVSQFSGGFGKVNVTIWPLAERLAFVNAAWAHFQKIGRPFPFTARQHLVPDVDWGDVPHVDASNDPSASQAG